MEEEIPGPPGPSWTGKQIGVLIILLVVTNAVTGAVVFFTAPRGTGPSPLTVIGPWSGAEKEQFLPVLETFTEQTGIETQFLTFRQEELQTLLPPNFAAGETPGDVIFMVESFIRQFGDQGHAMDVTDSVTPDDYIGGAISSVTVDGTIYGGVFTGNAKPGFWYKPSLFEANGWSTDLSTYDDLASLAGTIDQSQAVTAPFLSGDGVGWPLSDTVEHFIATYGGADMTRDLIAGNLDWDSPAVRDIFANRLVPLLEAGYFSEPIEFSEGYTRLWQEEYALYFMGSWITGETAIQDPSDLAVLTLPGGTTNQGVVFAPNFLFVPTYTDRPAEAVQLFEFLISAEGQAERVAQGGALPTHRGVDVSRLPSAEASVWNQIQDKEFIPDIDDTIGGDFQTTFWSQLQLLWVQPGELDSVLATIQDAAEAELGS